MSGISDREELRISQLRSSEGLDEAELYPADPAPSSGLKRWLGRLMVAIGVLIALSYLLSDFALLRQAFSMEAHAEEVQHRHPPEDAQSHEQFYKNWTQPDNREASCCNLQDCFPTEIKVIEGKLFAKSKWTQRWVYIPPNKIDREARPYDGQNHACMTLPNAEYPGDQPLCFAYGLGS